MSDVLSACIGRRVCRWEYADYKYLSWWTRFARMTDTRVDPMGVPRRKSPIRFRPFGRTPGDKVESLGVPIFNVSIVFDTL